MIFFIFLCFLFSYFIYGIYLSTIYKNDKSYNDNGELVDNKETMQWGFFVTLGISTVLLLIVTMFSSRVTMSDFWIALLLFGVISGITSLLVSRRQKKKHNRNDFKKINRNTLILIVLFFVFVGMTSEAQDTVSNESTAGVEESNDEADETAANKNNKQEEKVNEDEQKELSEKEKELNEREQALEEKERALEEKEEQELAAKEKAELEEEEKQLAKEQEEKEEQERIEKEEEERVAKEKEAKAREKADKEKAETAKEGLIPVDLYRVVDGDTVNVFDDQGNELKLRLLLIDTPETVHPNKPVEPFGPEASERLTELVNSGEQLYIEYDTGAKTDHYDRHLVYLYVGDTNVHEVLLEEGLARVGYIYEQQKYLEEFRAAEQIARDQQIGIWSIPGYVNEAGEGFNSESNETPSSDAESSTNNNSTSGSNNNSSSSQPTQPGTGQYFKNCDDLRTVHPAGVPQGHADYQPKMDRDKDGWACE